MSYTASFIKTAIKWAPKGVVLWVANRELKGIAELIDFSFDLDARKAYVKTQLCGEAAAIEVLLENFAVINNAGSYEFILQQAQSNRPWLNNLLGRIIGRRWKIPVIPQLAAYMGLIAELFAPES